MIFKECFHSEYTKPFPFLHLATLRMSITLVERLNWNLFITKLCRISQMYGQIL